MFEQNINTYAYALPLKAFPASAFFNNNSSAFKHPNFVEEAIEEPLRKRCIDEHDNAPAGLFWICSILIVFSRVRVLNMRTFERFRRFLSQVYFFTFDLESGYHHVSITNNFSVSVGCLVMALGEILPLMFCLLVCLQLALFSLSCYGCLLLFGGLWGMFPLLLSVTVYLAPVIELAREPLV